jgi:hypothetical protein
MLSGRLSVVVVLTVAFAGCGGGDGRRVVLPEDPCALVRADDVAAAVHAQVSKVERVPSIDQVVAAQDKGAALPDSSHESLLGDDRPNGA